MRYYQTVLVLGVVLLSFLSSTLSASIENDSKVLTKANGVNLKTMNNMLPLNIKFTPNATSDTSDTLDKMLPFSSACNTIQISNTIYQKSSEGKYSRRSGTCSNRVTYVHEAGHRYIYYLDAGILGAWMVGPTVCVDYSGIAVFDGASTPDKVAAVWMEGTTGGWVESPSLTVKCTSGLTPSLSGGAIVGIVLGVIMAYRY